MVPDSATDYTFSRSVICATVVSASLLARARQYSWPLPRKLSSRLSNPGYWLSSRSYILSCSNTKSPTHSSLTQHSVQISNMMFSRSRDNFFKCCLSSWMRSEIIDFWPPE